MSAISTLKTRHLLREFILRSSSVTDLVGQRVYGQHLSDSDAGTVLKAGSVVVLGFDSGDLRWYGAVQTQIVEVYAYSKQGLSECAKVYDAVCSLIQHERVVVDGIDICLIPREIQRPVDGYNDSVDAWFVKGRWIIEGV